MQWSISQVTAPAAEPVDRDADDGVKKHLRVTHTADDDYITALITVAREQVEALVNRALITQTWDLTLNAFPLGRYIPIPRPPLQSVTSISYIDEDGVSNTFDSNNYFVDTSSEPGRIVLNTAADWPSESLRPAAAVTVRYVSGYGSSGSDVPARIKQAILMLIGHLYENREPVNIGNIVTEIPLTVKSLLVPLKVWYEL